MKWEFVTVESKTNEDFCRKLENLHNDGFVLYGQVKLHRHENSEIVSYWALLSKCE